MDQSFKQIMKVQVRDDERKAKRDRKRDRTRWADEGQHQTMRGLMIDALENAFNVTVSDK